MLCKAAAFTVTAEAPFLFIGQVAKSGTVSKQFPNSRWIIAYFPTREMATTYVISWPFVAVRDVSRCILVHTTSDYITMRL